MSDQPKILFEQVCALLHTLQHFKGKRYGDAYCKRGEIFSIFPNIARKWDRLEKMMTDYTEGKPIPHPEAEETIAETVADLATYSILWMDWIRKNRPAEYDAWQKRIEKMTGEQNG